MLLFSVPSFTLPSFHYSCNNVIFITELYFLYSSCSYLLELIFKRQSKLSSPPERLRWGGGCVFHFTEPLSLNNCLKVNSSKFSMKRFCLYFTSIEMIYMELEVETLISFSMFNLIWETWPPLEVRGFSLLHTLSGFYSSLRLRLLPSPQYYLGKL